MTISRMIRFLTFTFLAPISLSLWAEPPQTISDFATLQSSGNGVAWTIDASVNYKRAKLTLSSNSGENTVITSKHEPYSGMLADGGYSYELVLIPAVSPATREMMKAARKEARGKRDSAPGRALRQQGVVPAQRYIQSGNFSILNGQLVSPDTIEE